MSRVRVTAEQQGTKRWAPYLHVKLHLLTRVPKCLLVVLSSLFGVHSQTATVILLQMLFKLNMCFWNVCPFRPVHTCSPQPVLKGEPVLGAHEPQHETECFHLRPAQVSRFIYRCFHSQFTLWASSSLWFALTRQQLVCFWVLVAAK